MREETEAVGDMQYMGLDPVSVISKCEVNGVEAIVFGYLRTEGCSNSSDDAADEFAEHF